MKLLCGGAQEGIYGGKIVIPPTPQWLWASYDSDSTFYSPLLQLVMSPQQINGACGDGWRWEGEENV